MKKLDIFYNPSSVRLHFDEDYNQKTVCGGVCALLIIVLLIILTVSKILTLFKKEKYTLLKLEEEY